MPKKVDLSVIIVNHNTSNLLKQCLFSINKTKKNGLRIQTVVVDNASTDRSINMVKKNFPQVTLIESKKNLGFSKGNNLGLFRALGKYILFLNTDTILPKNIFPKLTDYLDHNPKVGALTVRLVLRDGKMDPDCHRGFPTPWASLTYFLGLETLFPKSRLFGQYHQFYKSQDRLHEIGSACGAFLLVRKKVLDEVGPWDEAYFFYGEDIDLCYRIKERGYKIIFYPKIKVTHYKGASSGLRKETADITKASRETRLRVARASTQAMEIFYNKFYKQKYPWFFTSLIIFGIKIKGLIRLILNYLKS